MKGYMATVYDEFDDIVWTNRSDAAEWAKTECKVRHPDNDWDLVEGEDYDIEEVTLKMRNTVDVLYMKGDEIIVTGASGAITRGLVEEWESEEFPLLDEDGFFDGDGVYTLSWTYRSAQTGEFGRVEVPAHFDWDVEGFEPIEGGE